MNEQETAKIISRVKKMLALAAPDSGATEGERDNALRMAYSTLAKHNLSLSQVESASGKADEKRLGGAYETKTTHPWERSVASAVAKLMFCEYFYILRTGRGTQHFFVGRESNVNAARDLQGYLVDSINREALRMEKARTGEARGATYWRSFCKGAAWRIYSRCDSLRREAEEASAKMAKDAQKLIEQTNKFLPVEQQKQPGTALVLASVYEQEQKANLAFMEESMGIPAEGDGALNRPKDRTRSPDWSAASDGQKYGDRVNLTPIPTDKTKRIK